MSTRFAMPDEMEFPTMTICIQDGMKKSVKDEYGLLENVEFWFNIYRNQNNSKYVGPPNQTLSETFEDLSFVLNRDYVVGISLYPTLDLTNLTLGMNSVPSMDGVLNSYSVEPLHTLFFGTCLKIQPIGSGSWFKTHRVTIKVTLLIDNLKKRKDRPKAFDIYLTSNETWHGVELSNWKRFKPTIKSLKFGKQKYLSIWNIERIFREGIRDSTSCYTEVLMRTANCSYMCDMRSYTLLPPCRTYEELTCMLENWDPKEDCLRHKIIKRYAPTDRQNKIALEHESNVVISFESKESQIMEEIDVISFPNLIGSIGGSLGMFFGFSFAGYFQVVFDKCFERFFK